MKKRAIPNEEEVVLIKKWLGFKTHHCPFLTLTPTCICGKFFPVANNRCPCHAFGRDYVKRVARRLIK